MNSNNQNALKMPSKTILNFTLTYKAFVLLLLSFSCSAQQLELRESQNGTTYISYANAPAFGYGASPQNILTYLPTGNGNDYRDWLQWAEKYKMNHVRSYPPSFAVETPAINIYQYAAGERNKFDLTKFDNRYFDELRHACKLMNDHGFFVHLQLWQSISWKRHWDKNYFNPINNINPDISKHAGPGEFMVLKNSILLEHQKKYVQKILDVTADLGNVYFDIANEIGNGTGNDKKWVLEILNTIRQWENKNGHKVLVTINDEGGQRVTGIDEIFKKSDLIIKDLGRWDEHVDTQLEYKKPTISVRNIDWNYKSRKRLYFHGANSLETSSNKKIQTRGRKYWWRMYMARVQMAAAYADTYDKMNTYPGAHLAYKILKKLGFSNLIPEKMTESYSLNTLAEDNFVHFRNFISNIQDYPSLLPYNNIVKDHPAAHNYCLQSSNEIVIYLESPNGNAGYLYPGTLVSLTNLLLSDGSYTGHYYNPDSGIITVFETLIFNGNTKLKIPGFNDDLAIYIRGGQKNFEN